MNRRGFILAGAATGLSLSWGSAVAVSQLKVGYFAKYSPVSQSKDDGSMSGLALPNSSVNCF